MFYEEKCVNGMWYWRGTPDGEWNEFTVSDLRNKLSEETKRADDAEAQRDKLAELLREAREWVGVGLDCCDDGNWVEGAFATVERIEERIDAALAEMEGK